MKIHPIIVHNSLQNIFYVLQYWDNKALVIDPCDAEIARSFLDTHNLDLERILITHEHYDHYEGVEWLNCSEVYAWEIAAENMPINVTHIFEDGEIVFQDGNMCIKAIFTPGHAEWHMMFEMSEWWEVGFIFSWDVLFQGWVGHTRRWWTEDLYESLQKFKKYSGEVVIYSGHNYLKTNLEFLKKYTPENIQNINSIQQTVSHPLYFTNLLQERSYNPFLTIEKNEFIKLRELRNNF